MIVNPIYLTNYLPHFLFVLPAPISHTHSGRMTQNQKTWKNEHCINHRKKNRFAEYSWGLETISGILPKEQKYSVNPSS